MGKIIGITGGIASGKSTVTNFLRQQGFQVVDADAVVHQLQKPGCRLFQALVQHFGQEIILPVNLCHLGYLHQEGRTPE